MTYLTRLAMLATANALLAHSSFATGFQLQLDHNFTGAAPESSTQPWITLQFLDVAPSTVQLTVSNLNLTGSENLSELYFNLAPSLNASKLSFTYVSGSGGFDLPTPYPTKNTFGTDGGIYDIMLDFKDNTTAVHEFTAGEYYTCTISGIAGLTAADFDVLGSPYGGAGPFYTAAHVSNITGCSTGGWISATSTTSIVPVPEPSAASLVGLAICAYFGFGMWKRCQKARADAPKLIKVPAQRRRSNSR